MPRALRSLQSKEPLLPLIRSFGLSARSLQFQPSAVDVTEPPKPETMQAPSQTSSSSSKVIRSVSCGEHHVGAVSEGGALFTWGRGASNAPAWAEPICLSCLLARFSRKSWLGHHLL